MSMVKNAVLVSLSVVSLLLGSGSATLAQQQPALEDKPYEAIDGEVDNATLRGWYVYHTSCNNCHGMDAVGTESGPDLVTAVKDLSFSAFEDRVLKGSHIRLPASEVTGDDQTALRQAMIEWMVNQQRTRPVEIDMPAWGSSNRVKPHTRDLYAYLRARADGALEPGRPGKLDQ